jgi:hypothetical protein
MSARATKPSSQADVVRHIGDRPLTIDDVVALSRGATTARALARGASRA